MATQDVLTAASVALRAEHLPAALELSRALEWPYRLEDWTFAFRLGRGFAVERDGRLAATALWWPYGEHFASTGMVIVAADARRLGIGRALMDAVLADAGGRTVVLNSTQEGLPLYARLGFEPIGQVHQHQAVLERAPEMPDAPIRRFAIEGLGEIRALDADATGMPREILLDALLDTADTLVIERAGRITGYGCARVWGRGIVVGPVVAENDADARALIAALSVPHVGKFVRIDVTAASGLSPWLDTIGLPRVDQVVTMARGMPPAGTGNARLFSLSNQSLG